MKRYIIGFALSGLLLFALMQGIKIFRDTEQKATLLKKLKEHPVGEVKITKPDLREGDIVFQQSLSPQSEAIQLATHAVYTHCGIVYKIGNDYFVYEAVEPVKLTSLTEWMGRGKGGHFEIKRLKTAAVVFTQPIIEKMKTVGEKYKGKHYDPLFDWSDDRIYCSELVWKIYKEVTGMELGRLQQLKDFDLSSEPVKRKLKERYGNKIPLQDTVISPVSIYESQLLETVKQ